MLETSDEKFKKSIPIGRCSSLVQVFAALLAEVFFWACGFIHYADASSVLPDFAAIALYEPSSGIFSKRCRI